MRRVGPANQRSISQRARLRPKKPASEPGEGWSLGGRDGFHSVPNFHRDLGRGGTRPYRTFLEQRPVRARLVEGGEEPVIEFELHPLRAALDFEFLRVIRQVAAGIVERLADAFLCWASSL